MSEGEITEQIVMMMELTLVGVSVFFSIVSAYIVALFYFLRRAPMGLKITAFTFFSLILLFLGVFAAGAFNHAIALHDALLEMSKAGTLSSVGDAVVEQRMVGRAAIDTTIRLMSWFALVLVFTVLGYFTFIHRWGRLFARTAAAPEAATPAQAT